MNIKDIHIFYTERALKRLNEEIARMQEMRQLTIKKMEEEKKKSRE